MVCTLVSRLINPRHMREGYSSHSVCDVCVCLYKGVDNGGG